MEGGKFMSEKQRGKKYLKTDTTSNLKKSLSRMLNMVLNDELSPSKANTMCRIMQLQYDIISDEMLEQLDEISDTINNLKGEGKI